MRGPLCQIYDHVTLLKPDVRYVFSDLRCGHMSEHTKMIRHKHRWSAGEHIFAAALHIPAA